MDPTKPCAVVAILTFASGCVERADFRLELPCTQVPVGLDIRDGLVERRAKGLNRDTLEDGDPATLFRHVRYRDNDVHFP